MNRVSNPENHIVHRLIGMMSQSCVLPEGSGNWSPSESLNRRGALQSVNGAETKMACLIIWDKQKLKISCMEINGSFWEVK